MNIDKTKFRKTWWEDRYSNIIDTVDEHGVSWPVKDKAEDCFYHSCFPCQITENIDHYGYHPKGIDKLLIKLPIVNKRVKKRIGKTFQHIYSMNTTLCHLSQQTVVAMVNSGDYTLDEALYVMANACERCSNVLDRKYLGEEYGYEEFSEDWKKVNTVCDFCMEENIKDTESKLE